jgi:phosphoserine phosphatase
MRIARAVTPLLACERASVFLHDARRNELWTTIALHAAPIRVPVSSGIVGLAFRSNEMIHCPDAYADPLFNAEPDRISGYLTRDLLAAPMLDWEGKPVGVLQAVNKITGGFTETDTALLRLLADQAGVAIQRWNLQQQALQNRGLQHEMELARRVQDATIPRHSPSFAGIHCAGWAKPASISGGDCYDLWTSGDRLGLLVADAAGHGIAPAMVVSQVRALVRALSESETDPVKILWRINDRLTADLEPDQFVTAFLAFITSAGQVQWCNTGHGSAILFQHGSPRILDPIWPPLGLMNPDEDGAPESAILEPGDSLAVLSDGITEAFGINEELFGMERVIAALQATPARDPDAAIAAVRAAVVKWQGKEEPADDQTMVMVRRDIPGPSDM